MPMKFLVILWTLLLFAAPNVRADELVLYLSPDGSDEWSGLSERREGTNGPKKTLAAAQTAWRAAMKSNACDRVRVLFCEGTWHLDKTLELTAEDRAVPLSLEALPGKKAVLLGSRPLDALTRSPDGSLTGTAAFDPAADPFLPGRLFSGTSVLTRARHPNADPADPIRGGFLYVDQGYQTSGVFGGSVGCIHNAGDSMTYSIRPDRDGKYTVWMYYGADNAPYNIQRMDGRMSLRYNDEKPVPIADTENTGAWTPSRWARAAVVSMKKGEGKLQWKNDQGGGIQIGGFVLSSDPDWSPEGGKLLDWKANPAVIVLPADSFEKSVGRQLAFSASGSKDGFAFTPGDLKSEWAEPGVELKIFQSGSCRAYQEIVGIESISTEWKTGVVRLTGKELTAMLGRGDRYYLENHSDFLDAPGEWLFDRESGTVKIIPPDGAVKDYRYAVCATLIRVVGTNGENAAPVRIDGLTFGETAMTRDEDCVGYSMGRYGTIQIDGTGGVTVERCAFFNIGRYAVAVNEGTENAVLRCQIERSAQGGVLLRDADKNMVADCTIRFLGSEYKHIGGVVLEGPKASNNTIIHNYISDSSRYGITLKSPGTQNRIAFNDVWNTGLETYDTGAIEVTQQDKTFCSNSVIENNRVAAAESYSTSGPDGKTAVYLSWGIYLDSFAGGYLVENNYVCGTSHGGFMLQGGQKNTVRNNIFRNGSEYQGYFANYSRNFKEIVFERNIVAWDSPEAGLTVRGAGITSNVLTCRDNLYGAPDAAVEKTGASLQTWEEAGIETGSAVADPMFLHPDRHDGLLKPESPAIKAGFKQLDLRAVGPREAASDSRGSRMRAGGQN